MVGTITFNGQTLSLPAANNVLYMLIFVKHATSHDLHHTHISICLMMYPSVVLLEDYYKNIII